MIIFESVKSLDSRYANIFSKQSTFSFMLTINIIEIFQFLRAIFLLVFVVVPALKGETIVQIPCEIIEIEDQKTCSVPETTGIESFNFTISARRDSTIERLQFRNKNIIFLPTRVDKNFPNLKTYDAFDCSIKSISRENFRNLFKLIILNLNTNNISEISSDAFNDLSELSILILGKNIHQPDSDFSVINESQFR